MDFDHNVYAMSWAVHNCASLCVSEQLEHFEVKRSVIDTCTGQLRGMRDYCLVMISLFPRVVCFPC